MLAATSSPVLAQQAAITRRGGSREPLGRELAAQVATTLDSEFVARAYDSSGQLVADLTNPGAPAPDLPMNLVTSRQTVDVDGRSWRVAVGPIPDRPRLNLTLLTALPMDDSEAATAAVRRRALVVGTLAVGVAALRGWALAGRALTPLRRLREHAAAVQDKPTPVPRGHAAETRETAELADALDGMLARLDAARAQTAQALETARDYAAAAAHELRTPLTTMRTDLDVLRAHPDLDVAERAVVLAELTNALTRMERTLTALGQLARGDLAGPRPAVPVDLAEVVVDAIADVRRHSPGADLRAELPAEPVVVTGWPDGLRIAVDNLLANAVRHGTSQPCRLVQVAVRHGDNVAQVVVDDAGPGIPADEREAVFARFRRGRDAPRSGSGLGLALVSQQAALHGGRAWVETSPLGVTRAVLQIPSEPVERSPGSGQALATADSPV